MKIKTLLTVAIILSTSQILSAYEYPGLYVSDKKSKKSKKNNSNEKQNKSIETRNSHESKKDIKLKVDKKDEKTNFSSFENNSIFKGVEDFGNSSEATTINYIAGKINKEEIISIKKKKEELSKIKNDRTLVEQVLLKSETMYYDTEQGLERTIYLKYGYSTDIEFLDDLGNPIGIRGMSVGNMIFDASNPEPNMLSLLATSKYRETNFNVRLDGVKDPVILRIKEGSNNISHTRVKIVVGSDKVNEDSTEINLKTNILKELLKYGTLHGETKLDYEVIDIARKETTYFEKKYLKIFRVEKYNKTYSIVLLDSQFEILGMHKNSFNRYQNSFNVYFLEEHKEIFTIMTKLNETKNHMSFDFQKDSGLIEKYRILINE